MIPLHYPVTMVDPTGREYEVHSAVEYVSARFKRGHEALEPKPEPKPQAKAEPEPKPVPVPEPPKPITAPRT